MTFRTPGAGKVKSVIDEQGSPAENGPSGFRYQADRLAQQIRPLRAVDGWGLKHPVVNALSFVVIGVFFAVILSMTWHSWLEGVLAGIAIAVLVVLSTRANHRRRLQNGTSAEYGRPG
jgi:protein-S-isoprenylcysteine O-methyltransferase Ste14